MTPPALALEGVRFAYGTGAPVLHVEHLTVDMGSKVFLFGPSGSGKTTLLGLVTGVLRAREGAVKVLGTDLSTLSGSRRDAFRGERLGYIFQMFNLVPYLSALDNIKLPCEISRARRAHVRGSLDDEARRLAGRLDIVPFLDRKPGELSVGQQQRVAAARALIGRPRLVVADEPTSALDADRRELFLDLLFDVCGEAEASLLFVSHDRGLERRFDVALDLTELNRAHLPAS
jgi:putative ABC transport system ATP-binding protein